MTAVIRIPLGLRNLLRNRRRTAIAVAAICFGVIAMLLAGGFIEWIFWAMRESAIQGRLGHIQVTRPGYREAGVADPFAYLLSEESPQFRVLGEFPHVRLVTPRLRFSGLASHGPASVSFNGEGVEPEKEGELSVDFRISTGQDLAGAEESSVVLGTGLAKNLGVQPGDTITLLATTRSGGPNALELVVAGIFFTSDQVLNESTLRLPISVARRLLRVSGAHSWVILLDETKRTENLLRELQVNLPEEKFELTPWYEMADFYRKTERLFSRQMQMMQLVVALIILLSISNVMTMSVLERASEIGTMMAIGVKRGRILRLFLAEGATLGLMGGVIGTTFGVGLAQIISRIGIPMPPAPGMEEGFTGEILVTWPLVAGGLALALMTTCIASVYPAWKASRMEIVNALRHNR